MFIALFYWESGVLGEMFKAGAAVSKKKVVLFLLFVLPWSEINAFRTTS